jgi:dUTP pyrophosphatase
MTASAIAPARATIGSVGYDICSCENEIVKSGQTKIIKTGIRLEIPYGYEVQIRPRSGISVKTDIIVMLGTIDSDYRGEIGIICKNVGLMDYEVKIGDRLAQFIINKIELMEMEETKVDVNTDRGEGGFGSTGYNGNVEFKTLIDKLVRSVKNE